MPSSNKRGPPELMKHQWVKRQRSDDSFIPKCSFVLEQLMNEPAGWIFSQPVDPVALNIPDYFSIISNPMDLGTVKSKLENHVYLDAEEFAADVRLTFSNSMLYNPPDNDVHLLAEDLSNTFEAMWAFLEINWNHDSPEIVQQKHSSGPVKEMNNTGKEVDKGSRDCGKLLHEGLTKFGEFKKKSDTRDAEQHDKEKQDWALKSSRANFQEGCPIYDEQPCSKQELHAVMLKRCCDEIIAKALQIIFNHGKIPYPLKGFENIQREGELSDLKFAYAQKVKGTIVYVFVRTPRTTPVTSTL